MSSILFKTFLFAGVAVLLLALIGASKLIYEVVQKNKMLKEPIANDSSEKYFLGKNDSVYFVKNWGAFGPNALLVIGADPQTFQSSIYTIPGTQKRIYLAQDKNGFYYEEVRLPFNPNQGDLLDLDCRSSRICYFRTTKGVYFIEDTPFAQGSPREIRLIEENSPSAE